MTANEWLGVMKQASDFPEGMEKLILKYGEMLIAEHEGTVKKLTIPDVIGSVCRCKRCNCEIKNDVGDGLCDECWSAN